MKVGVLGPLEVRDGAATIEVAGARLRLLLTMLALDAPRSVSTSTLVEALWGEEPPADEVNALQSLVSRLRRALGDADLVRQSTSGYRLDIEAADVDLHRFEQLARRGHAALRGDDATAASKLLSEAMALWRGDPVAITETPHSHALLARLDEHRLDAQADLAEAKLALGLGDAVVAELEGLVAAHPLRERFAALLVRALYAGGRQAEALASYERARAVLADELGVDPSAELKAAHLSVLRGDPTPHPAPAPLTARRPNLRATLTTFVGREQQLAAIGNLLEAGRLVTLVGPGGAGKTRLAAESAATLATSGADSVWVAELAPVTDPADVPQTVLGSLGLRDAILLERAGTMTPRDATSRLIAALAERSAVLVLDNCEHLIDASAHLADQLLAACPELRIVATSREPLGIFGEALVVVPPLDQPAIDAAAKVALGYPAIQLFADRAVGVQPDFEVDESNVAAVIEIVRRLDGQPLAIELAAARLRSLPVAEIARRLSDRFRLLTGGSRTAMPRHRTLRAVVDWSWDLLSPAERLLAERLAVFSGGVTPTSAAAVCAAGDLDAADIDDLLSSLVDKSLLQPTTTTADGPRYRMLETIREFGLERMAERAEVGPARLAHADHFAAVVAEADPHLRRAEQLEWMAILAIERDNILAALRYFGDDGRAAAAIELVNRLGWYWMTIGNHGEIVTWVGFALEIPGDVDPIQRLMAEAFLAINAIAWNTRGSPEQVEADMAGLAEVGARMSAVTEDVPSMMALLAPVVAMFVDDLDSVGRLINRALDHDDPWIAASIRTFRAATAENNGDVETMRDDAETSLVTFRELGERWGMANCLQVLGQLEVMQGELESAAAAYREAIELAESIGSREDIAMMGLRLADVLTRLGDHDGAREQAQRGRAAAGRSGSSFEVLFTHIVEVDIARGAGDHQAARALRDDAIERLSTMPSVHPIRGHGLAIVLSTAAKIDLDDGDLASAKERLDEAYEHALKTKDMPIVAIVGVALAMYAASLGRLDDAAEILGAAARLRGADDATQLDIVALAKALGGLHEGPNAEHYARGRSLTRDGALARVNPASVQPIPRAVHAL